MIEIPRYIPDASIALGAMLQLPDEPYSRQSLKVLTDYEDGRINLLAPHHIRNEASHGMLRAVRRSRINESAAEVLLARFLDYPIPTRSNRALLTGGWQLSRVFGCSFYDGVYLALSRMTGLPYLHADEKLRNILAGRFP